jgi:molybdopterin molybdotransferase
MDGYAVRAADVATATANQPRSLPVVYEVAAGGLLPRPLAVGEAARIFTGALIPEGADAVVMQEEVRDAGDRVEIPRALRPGENVRPAGEDLQRGDLALAIGSPLGPAELALAAALGRGTLRVSRAPRVAIVTTGDELQEPGSALRPSGIYDSNGPAIAAAVEEAGGEVISLSRALDQPAAIRRALEGGAEADVLITIAGVSVGDRDYVRTALAELGATLDFWRVAMRPGKPVAFGRWQHRAVLGLPGNPVSALVTFELFGRPLLRRLAGHVAPDRFFVAARLGIAVKKPPQLALFVRGRFDGRLFVPAAKQGSGLLTSIAGQDALAELPVGPSEVEAGSEVRVRLLSHPSLGNRA